MLHKLTTAPRPAHPAVLQHARATQASAAAQGLLAPRDAGGTRMDVPCIDSDGGTKWLANPAVKEALHVRVFVRCLHALFHAASLSLVLAPSPAREQLGFD